MKKRISKRKPRNHYPNHKYVVYMDKVGRSEPGIHHRMVSIDGKVAFVHPPVGGKKADIVPAANVFESLEDAKAFFVGDGPVVWVVSKGDDFGAPEIFKARVKTYVSRRYNRWGAQVRTVVRLDGRPYQGRGLTEYDTEKDAYRHFFRDMEKFLKDVDQKMEDLASRKEALLRIKRRFKSFGIRRGFPE